MNLTQSDSVRYEMRNEIELIIKEYGIDRSTFYEAAKGEYERIVKRLYYTFCDYKKYPAIHTSYMWTRFREGLHYSIQIPTDWEHWDGYICQMDELIPKKCRMRSYYLLVDGGWVYEGMIEPVKAVLFRYPNYMEDFYLFPRDYSWVIHHCDDGECMYRVWKE